MSTSSSPEPLSVTLNDHREFASVMKLRIWRWGEYPDHPGRSTVIIRVFTRGRLVVGTMMMEACGLSNQRKGSAAKAGRCALELKKGRSPLTP